MKFLLYVLVIIIHPSFTLSVIKSGDDLVRNLCEKKFREDVTLTLDHSISYNITLTRTCVVNITDSITIKSNTSDIVTVSCIHQHFGNPVPTVAFGFTDTKVTVSDIVFDGCGALLKGFHQSFIKKMNSMKLHFTGNQAALFVFVNTAVILTKVNISNYYGFAVIGVNLQSSRFSTVNITSSIGIAISSRSETSIGSGMVIFFNNSTKQHIFPVIVQLHQCTFHANYDYDMKDNESCVASKFIDTFKPLKIFNSAALTVISDQEQRNHFVNIYESSFIRNSGTHAGALMILILNSTNTYVRIDKSCLFQSNNNISPCPGSAISFYMENKGLNSLSISDSYVPLKVLNTRFYKQDGIKGDDLNFKLFRYGAVFVGVRSPSVSLIFEFKNLTFLGNIAEEYGSCLFSTMYDFPAPPNSLVTIKVDNVEAHHNRQIRDGLALSNSGLFVFINNQHVIFSGTSKFSHNIGTVVKSQNSPINLKGTICFEYNQAKSGAAFNIKDSFLQFSNGLQLRLHHNSVEDFGGAIYIDNKVYSPLPACALQFLSNDSHNVSLINNTAENGGNSIYAFPLYNCYQAYSGIQVHSEQYYTEHIGHQNDSSRNDLLDISSNAKSILHCRHHTDQIHYPGETIRINIKAVDESKNHVYSLVQVRLIKMDNTTIFKTLRSSIQPLEEIQTVKETKHSNSCTQINITINYHDAKTEYRKLYLFLEPTDDGNFNNLQHELHLTPCPLGFALINGYCQCSPAVKTFYSTHNFNGRCDINTRTIQKPNILINPWLGPYLKNGSEFSLSHSCPIEYCFSSLEYSVFKLNESSKSFVLAKATDLSRTMTLCRRNRVGIICGECEEGYSVVFGSGECEKCSNWYLWTLIFYGISGPLLIYFLYVLRLTLTAGTLNSIIFFAQASNVGILQALYLFERNQIVFSEFLRIFLSLLNLNLGFPLCFFNGMNELWKTGLSLVFPVYLITTVLVLIVLSQYSSKLSNRISHSSVQVLVTVVHLSVSKLLITIIDVFTPATVYKDSDDKPVMVWYRNGTIAFSFRDHHLLILMGLTVIVVSAFVIPYFMLLTGGRCFIKSSLGDKYFRSAYESIHGPFRENRKFWFSSRFILLIILYIIFAILRGCGVGLVCIASLPLLIVFLMVQVHLRPFKNKLINLIDTAVVLDLVMIYVIGWYNMAFDASTSKLHKSIIAIIVLIFLIFVLFVCIIFYHISLVIGCFGRLLVLGKKKCEYSTASRRHSDSTLLLSHEAHGSFYQSCNDFREPVAEHQ